MLGVQIFQPCQNLLAPPLDDSPPYFLHLSDKAARSNAVNANQRARAGDTYLDRVPAVSTSVTITTCWLALLNHDPKNRIMFLWSRVSSSLTS